MLTSDAASAQVGRIHRHTVQPGLRGTQEAANFAVIEGRSVSRFSTFTYAFESHNE
jgi:hypothetical protein